MTIRIEDDIAWLEGACGVADAEPLFAAFRADRVTTVNLSSCRSIHAAVAQTLMRFGVKITGVAPDGFVRDFVAPALEGHRTRIRASAEGVRTPGFTQIGARR
jgi:hypothetical protein